MDSGYCRDKLAQYKIGGQSKPFIDKNLQLQIPGYDAYLSPIRQSYSPIYSHYISSSPASFLPPPINEAELYHAMQEAEHAYLAWKRMQQQIKNAVNSYPV